MDAGPEGREPWRAVPVADLSGTVLLLGGTDAGKSTLARWLTEELARRLGRAAWLDADMGQSSFGLPTTQNLFLATTPTLPPSPRPVCTFFVGSASPRAHMLPALAGVVRLAERARELGARAVVVDTTGFVSREGGGAALKEWKVALLRPRTVIALQREDELEPIVAPLRREPGTRVHVLPVSPRATVRPPADRADRRRELLERYFRGALPRHLDASSLPVYAPELALPGHLVALQDEDGFAVGLGVLQENLGGGRYGILTPAAVGAARSLRFGTASFPEAAAQTGVDEHGPTPTRS